MSIHKSQFAPGDLGRRRRARRHARLDLHRQPVPAQFGRRHRAQSGDELGLSPAEIGLLSSTFFFAFAAAQIPARAWRSTGSARAAACWSARGIAVRRRRPVRVGAIAGGADLSARALLGSARRRSLMAPLAVYARAVSARAVRDAGRPAGRARHPRHADRDRAARVLDGGDRLARQLPRGRRRSPFVVGRADRGRGQGRRAPRTAPARARDAGARASPASLAVMRTPSIGRLFLMNLVVYSCFVLIVGLWGGPYLTHVYGYGLEERGNFLFDPGAGADRRLAAVGPDGPAVRAATSCRCWSARARPRGARLSRGRRHAAAGSRWSPGLRPSGSCAAYRPVLIAHGKSLFPPHLVGRGLTVLNMGSMGGVFLVQTVSGFVIELFPTARTGLRARCLSPACSACRRRLSYWPVWFISARTIPLRRSGRREPCARSHSKIGQYHLLLPLLFVRRGACCCSAVAPRVTAALLGRFLPRLGPLASASGPFSCRSRLPTSPTIRAAAR